MVDSKHSAQLLIKQGIFFQRREKEAEENEEISENPNRRNRGIGNVNVFQIDRKIANKKE